MKFKFTILQRYDVNGSGTGDLIIKAGVHKASKNSMYKVDSIDEICIGRLFDRYSMTCSEHMKMMYDVTEPLANQVKRFIVVQIQDGIKSVLVPSKYSRLYFRPKLPEVYSAMPYLDDNMKACSMTYESAEAMAHTMKGFLNKKDPKKRRRFKIEQLNSLTLF